MEGTILLLALTALMAISYYLGRKTGQCEAYDQAFDDIVHIYEEVLAEEGSK